MTNRSFGARPDTRAAIASLGNEITPAAIAGVMALYDAEQRALAVGAGPVAVDLAYGPDERHRLDVYAPPEPSETLRPVFVWVHGGGFRRGDKGAADRWPDAHAGRMAAANGMIGVTINYRLTPSHTWPCGAEDLCAVVDWLKRHAGDHGGDADRIILCGTSAGAAHVAGYLKRRPQHSREVRGAIMLSGLYGVTEMNDERDLGYYGEDRSLHAGRTPLEAVVETGLPLLLACAEFDPPRFQAEYLGALRGRLDRHGALPRSFVATGHSHFSLAYHLGTADRAVLDQILAFIDTCCDERGAS